MPAGSTGRQVDVIADFINAIDPDAMALDLDDPPVIPVEEANAPGTITYPFRSICS